jgi:hypothetical protein
MKLGDGHAPLASPDGGRILFLHEGKVFAVAPRKGAKAGQLFKTRGVIDSLRFSCLAPRPLEEPETERIRQESNNGAIGG